MAALAMQIAFTVPIGLVVVVAMLAGHVELFFPASMVIVWAHCLARDADAGDDPTT